MSFGAKVIGNRIKGREKALCMSRGFEPPHGSLSLPRRLVRVFGAIIQAFVLAMFDAGYDFLLGGRIASQFVRDDHAWYVPQPYSFFSQTAVSSLLGQTSLSLCSLGETAQCLIAAGNSCRSCLGEASQNSWQKTPFCANNLLRSSGK